MTASDKLRQDAIAIWQAGVEAVKPQRLFRDKVSLDGTHLNIEELQLDLAEFERLVVVGAGKASAAMAVALQHSVLDQLAQNRNPLPVCGWVNVPEETFSQREARALGPIHLHAARPAGLNWPTEAAVMGTQQILNLVRGAGPRDLVICLLSGGGSALLVAPRPGISLADKQAVARELAAAGANIEQLNLVRRTLSEIKGGGLARICNAQCLLTLVLSDVLGDPLEVIASGPTLPTVEPQPQEALAILQQLGLQHVSSLSSVVQFLKQQLVVGSESNQSSHHRSSARAGAQRCQLEQVILGNNADAIDAAGVKAVELGYRYVMQGAKQVEGDVLQVAKGAVAAIQQLTSQENINCWISGGEPTVVLPAQGAGKGGRNQQLALAVLHELQSSHWGKADTHRRPVVFVSGGTDGEDGPTDAAGAWIDSDLNRRAKELGLDASDYLRRADAYSFFNRAGGLLRTGPTGTNVCDLRVALAGDSDRS